MEMCNSLLKEEHNKNADAGTDTNVTKAEMSANSELENLETSHVVPNDDAELQFGCSDGERAILSSYISLMRQCIEFAEKAGAAKA